MPEIDLEKPEKILASADNAKDYTFYLVADKPHFTREAFAANPNVASGNDLFFKSPVIPDKDGKSFVDLAPQAKSIKDKLKDERTPAIAVVVANSMHEPGKRDAALKAFTLKKNAADIELKELVVSVSSQNWIAYHHAIMFVGMKAKGAVRDVVIDVNPKTQPIPIICGIWTSEPGKTGISRLILGGVGDQHGPNAKCTFPQNMHSQWATLWGAQASRGFVEMALEAETDYVIGIYPRMTGSWTLTVSGKGAFSYIKKNVTLKMNGAHPAPGD